MLPELPGPLTQLNTRAVRSDEAARVLSIINSAAQAYRGHIPDDCWHDPYMSADELDAEVKAGVCFRGLDLQGELVAVMGVQRVLKVWLIRHAYVDPRFQNRGLGSRLIEQICNEFDEQLLVGTWQDASWAISFYERHGFRRVSAPFVATLLKTYWQISARQTEVSVVLARPALEQQKVGRLPLEAAP